MALTFELKVTGLCCGVISAARDRVDTVMINANASMMELPYHLQTLLLPRDAVVAPPAGLVADAPLASHSGRLDGALYKVSDVTHLAWDLNGTRVRICEGGVAVSAAQLTVADPAEGGSCPAGGWTDLHWVLDLKDLAEITPGKPGLDPDWNKIGQRTLAVFEMLKGTVTGCDPFYTMYTDRILQFPNGPQTCTDAWAYRYQSPDNTMLLELTRSNGAVSYIACDMPAGGLVGGLLLNEGVPGVMASPPPHMLAFYDLLEGPPQPADRQILAETGNTCSGIAPFGDGSSCMSSLYRR